MVRLRYVFNDVNLTVQVEIVRRRFLGSVRFGQVFSVSVIHVVIEILQLYASLMQRDSRAILILFENALVVSVAAREVPKAISITRQTMLVDRSISLNVPRYDRPITLVVVNATMRAR